MPTPSLNPTPATPAPAFGPGTTAEPAFAFVVARLTAAGGGALPDGSPRWALPDDFNPRRASPAGRVTTHLLHLPSGAGVAAVYTPGRPGHGPTVRLKVPRAVTGNDDLTVAVARDGSGSWAADLATLFAAYTARRVEERERERRHEEEWERRRRVARDVVLLTMREDGLLDLAPDRQQAREGQDPAVLRWCVPAEITNREVPHKHNVAFFAEQAAGDLMLRAHTRGGREATTADVRALKVRAGHCYTYWDDSTNDTTMPWPVAVRFVKAMLTGALAHRAAIDALTPREDAPAEPTVQ